jgi:hypothetical protein
MSWYESNSSLESLSAGLSSLAGDGAQEFFGTAYLPDYQIKVEVMGLAFDDARLDTLIVGEDDHSHTFQQTLESEAFQF